jgi:hypothetical protein
MENPRIIRLGIQSISEPDKTRIVEIYLDGSSRCCDSKIKSTGELTGQGCFAGESGKVCRHQKVAYKILSDLLAKMKYKIGGSIK